MQLPNKRSMSRYRALLVDDMVPLRQLIRLTLERSGQFEVVGEAGNGRDGVEVAEALQPDLVLLDVSMPVMDGLEALPRIRSVAPDATVVMLSGFSELRLGADAAAGGASAYLEKGLAPDVLVQRLLEVMGGPPG